MLALGGVREGGSIACRPVNTPVRPPAIAPPAANYELAMVTQAPAKMLFTAGIVGVRPDGSVPDGVGDQAAEMWTSVRAILEEAGFAVTDIVAYTTYVVHGADLRVVMEARDRFLGGHSAASTLVPVPALARSEWKVEVAVVASRSRQA